MVTSRMVLPGSYTTLSLAMGAKAMGSLAGSDACLPPPAPPCPGLTWRLALSGCSDVVIAKPEVSEAALLDMSLLLLVLTWRRPARAWLARQSSRSVGKE